MVNVVASADTFRPLYSRVKNGTVAQFRNSSRAGITLASVKGLQPQGNLMGFASNPTPTIIETTTGNVGTFKQLTVGALSIQNVSTTEDFDEVYSFDKQNAGLEPVPDLVYLAGLLTLDATSTDKVLVCPTTTDLANLANGSLVDIPLGDSANNLISMTGRVFSFATVGSGASALVNVTLVESMGQTPYIGNPVRLIDTHGGSFGGSNLPKKSLLNHFSGNDNSFRLDLISKAQMRSAKKNMPDPKSGNQSMETTYELIAVKKTETNGNVRPEFSQYLEDPGTYAAFDG